MTTPFQKGTSGGPFFGPAAGGPATFTAPFSSQNQTSAFGNVSGFGQAPSFGSQTFSFGSVNPFGSQSSSTSGFGAQTTTPSIFGGPPLPSTQSGQTFGSQPNISFGSSQFGGFGTTTQPSFGTTQGYTSPFHLFSSGGNQSTFGGTTQSFGTSQPSFGSAQGFSGGQQSFGVTTQPTFGTSQPTFGTVQSVFGGSPQPGFGTAQSGFGTTQSGFGTTPSGFGTTQSVFGTTPSGFGTNQSGFGTTQSGFGTTPSGFGASQSGFGTTQSGFGTTQSTFGSGFGTTAQPFGGGQQGFGTGQVFGTGQGFGTAQPSFASGQQGFGSPQGFTTGQATTPFQSSQTQASTFGFGTTPAQQGFSFANIPSPFSFSPPPTTTSVGFVNSPMAIAATKPPVVSQLSNTLMSRPILKPTSTSSTLGSLSTIGKPESSLSGAEAGVNKVGKEMPLPQPLVECVSCFKTFVHAQKNNSSDISRASLQPIKKVSEDIEIVKQILVKLDCIVFSSKSLIKQVKSHTVRGLSDCEIAQRTIELAGNFQTNNPALCDYFVQVAERFLDQVISLRLQVEVIERHIFSVLNPRAFTPQELSLTLQRIHESFVALAGRMHLLHSSLVSIKNQQFEFAKKKFSWMGVSHEGTVIDITPNINSLPDPSPLCSGNNTYYVLNMWARRAKLDKSFRSSKINPTAANGALPSSTGFTMSGLSMFEHTTIKEFPLRQPPSNKRWKK